MDAPRCAAIHNEIVKRLVQHPQGLEFRVVSNWFSAYGEAAERVRDKLSTPVIEFLEHIDVPLPNDSVNITPHAFLSSPEDLWSFIGGNPNGVEDHDNWVALYVGTYDQFVYFFDMDTNLGAYQRDTQVHALQWYPLQRTLQVWLSLYETGKFRATQGEAVFDPRIRLGSIEHDLRDSLQAWDLLLDAIIQRAPDLEIAGTGLIPEDVLDRFRVRGFVRQFLLRARRPTFEFVAPELRVPSVKGFVDLLSKDMGSERYKAVREELLVPEEDDASLDGQEVLESYVGEPLPLLFGPEYHSKSEVFEDVNYRFSFLNTSGLYFWPDVWFADGVKLLLPYSIGWNGYIKYGNLGLSQHNPPCETYMRAVNNDELFQHGECPFMDDHPPQLATVLNKFRQLVMNEQWTVGPGGIVDTVEKFQQADTVEFCELYRLGACFDDDR